GENVASRARGRPDSRPDRHTPTGAAAGCAGRPPPDGRGTPGRDDLTRKVPGTAAVPVRHHLGRSTLVRSCLLALLLLCNPLVAGEPRDSAVKVTGTGISASGVVVGREGNRSLVVTNRHVCPEKAPGLA